MDFKPGDSVVVIPGQETRLGKYTVEPGRLYTVHTADRNIFITLKELPYAIDIGYKNHKNPAFDPNRFRKIDPNSLTKLQRALYGIN